LSNRRDHRRDRVVAALGIVIASAGLFSLMLASSGRSFGALPIAIVQLLAVAEIVCAAGLFFSRTRRPAGLSLIALLLILWGDEHVTWRSEDTTAARTSPASGSLAAHQPSSWQITNSGMWNDLVDVPHLELASADNGQVRIEIPRTTAERLPWQIQAVQAGHDLRRGAVYRLRFRARGDANRLLDYSVEGMDAPHLSSTDVEVQLTPEWQKYSVVLEALSDGGSQVAFKVGQSAVSLDLADVKLEEMKDVRPGEIVSWVLDVHSAEARAHAPRLELPDGPPWRIRVHLDESMHPGVSWAVQLNHHGVSVQHGHRYTLQFQARADAARPFSYMVGRGRAPFDDLGLYINDVLATDWRPYKNRGTDRIRQLARGILRRCDSYAAVDERERDEDMVLSRDSRGVGVRSVDDGRSPAPSRALASGGSFLSGTHSSSSRQHEHLGGQRRLLDCALGLDRVAFSPGQHSRGSSRFRGGWLYFRVLPESSWVSGD
jgi:cytochrome c oxidase assembly protein Cox11